MLALTKAMDQLLSNVLICDVVKVEVIHFDFWLLKISKKTLRFVFSLFGYNVELAKKSLLVSSQPSSALFLPRARTDGNQGLS
jgi:hypothetical protein